MRFSRSGNTSGLVSLRRIDAHAAAAPERVLSGRQIGPHFRFVRVAVGREVPDHDPVVVAKARRDCRSRARRTRSPRRGRRSARACRLERARPSTISTSGRMLERALCDAAHDQVGGRAAAAFRHVGDDVQLAARLATRRPCGRRSSAHARPIAARELTARAAAQHDRTIRVCRCC